MDDNFLQDLKNHEGYSVEPYKDTNGYLTGGIGHLMTERDAQAFNYEWSSAEKSEYWRDRFKEDVAAAANDVNELTKDWKVKPTKEQVEVLVDMRFNLGLEGLKGFTGFLGALSKGDKDTAADEMIDSQWHRDFVGWSKKGDIGTLRSRKLEHKMRNSKNLIDQEGIGWSGGGKIFSKPEDSK